eukprot:CAMPEP_0172476046 /NCGR_PEP_ID=MMETSP1065-20121228/70179_1 /TAXON_ID=265537 /ORGANISM="Amphiprora paludosa, Strain CCMP125" /LENGTH=631 /DNA_ID=CAMNT_0013234261 /DNA_START=62 /DNA_END=1954 /DNA_ORIENTATION=+
MKGFWITSLVCACHAFSPSSLARIRGRPTVSLSSLANSASSSDSSVPSTESAQTLDRGEGSKYWASFNETIDFPSCAELLQLGVGDFVTSPKFTITTNPAEDGTTQEYDFCVKFYPRGGGHSSQHSMYQSAKNAKNGENDESGFGMSYAVLPMFGSQARDEKVGVYLQYLPRSPSDTVDASFALRIKGQQRIGRRFDVEWRSGIRFVSLENSKLQQGMANDFGAHLMQTELLEFVMGVHDDGMGDQTLTAQENGLLDAQNRAKPVKLQVEVVLHAPYDNQRDSLSTEAIVAKQSREGGTSSAFGLLRIPDVRQSIGDESVSGAEERDKEPLRVGRIVVPVLQRLSQRPAMFQMGVYPGVEYRILRIIDTTTDGEEGELFYSKTGAEYELKPIYPLVQQLERPWPVRVKEQDIPKLITATQYNVISAVGSLFAAGSALVTAFVISQAISLFFIPSKSMEPTLQIGDVLLVEKVTPRLFFNNNNKKVGDVVLFHPPQQLQELVQRGSGRSVSNRDLFVKRIAALPGDNIQIVDKSGSILINGKEEGPLDRRNMCTAEPLRLIERYMDPGREIVIGQGQVGVLGDCGSVSVDSRVWGALPTEDIVGRPLIRLWPLSRFGSIDPLPTTPTITNDW